MPIKCCVIETINGQLKNTVGLVRSRRLSIHNYVIDLIWAMRQILSRTRVITADDSSPSRPQFYKMFSCRVYPKLS